jgi:hydrogenase maturation protease
VSGLAKVLVAGVGNVFLGDDGFGVEVARRLAQGPLPPGVEVADIGIRGIHLAYQLLDGYDLLILIDAVARDGPPGTLFVIEPDARTLVPELDAHGVDPTSVLELGRTLGSSLPRTLLVGCVPLSTEERLGLSPPVEQAVEEAVRLVTRFITGSISEEHTWSLESF